MSYVSPTHFNYILIPEERFDTMIYLEEQLSNGASRGYGGWRTESNLVCGKLEDEPFSEYHPHTEPDDPILHFVYTKTKPEEGKEHVVIIFPRMCVPGFCFVKPEGYVMPKFPLVYDDPVKFSKTNLYGCGPNDEDDVYTVSEFLDCVETGAFIDYDGFGHPVKDGMACRYILVKPSRVEEIPDDATHIVWYNR